MNGAMKEASSPITSAALADDKVDAWLNLSN